MHHIKLFHINMLFSAKLNISAFETKRNISFPNMLNNKGFLVDPCVMAQVTFHQPLKRKTILVLFCPITE